VKRFRFSLERVLKLRSQETEAAKRALARALSAEELARIRVLEAQAALTTRTEEAQMREQVGLTAAEFGAVRSFLAFLQRDLARAVQQLSLVRQVTEQRRRELMAARKRERALEKLRERRLDAYTLEVLREEQKELDEFGTRQPLNGAASGTDI
jgi:flagellar protein FliJ